MADTGWKAPGTAANAPIDTKPDWTFPDRAKADDASFAFNVLSGNDYGDWLQLTNFSFGVPAGATIDGIYVEVQRKASETGHIYDRDVKLWKSTSHVGDDKATFDWWATSEEQKFYGGAADDWNAGLTAADVNAAGFGISIAAFNDDGGPAPTVASIDFVQIKIYYTAAGTAHEKALSDTVTVSDSIVKAVGLNKADASAISDALAKTVGLFKTDSVAIADTIVKAIGLVKADAVTISDTFARVVAYAPSLADTVTISDVLNKAVGLVKTDTVTIADTFTRIVTWVRGLADSVTISDSFAKVSNYIRALADTVTITDSISKRMSIVKADAMAIADAMTSTLGHGLSIALFDVVTITDHLEGVLRIKSYTKMAIDRMEAKGLDIARMSIKRMGIDKMPLYRWIIRRWTA